MVFVFTEVATHNVTLKRSVGMYLVFPDSGVYCRRQLMNTRQGLFGFETQKHFAVGCYAYIESTSTRIVIIISGKQLVVCVLTKLPID